MIYYKNLPDQATQIYQTKAKVTTFFHLVDLSPWPVIVSASLYILTSGAAMYFNGYQLGGSTLLWGFAILVFSVSL